VKSASITEGSCWGLSCKFWRKCENVDLLAHSHCYPTFCTIILLSINLLQFIRMWSHCCKYVIKQAVSCSSYSTLCTTTD